MEICEYGTISEIMQSLFKISKNITMNYDSSMPVPKQPQQKTNSLIAVTSKLFHQHQFATKVTEFDPNR